MIGLTPAQWMATVFFAMAVLHTFLVSRFQRLAHRYPEGSSGENFFHLMGEVEASFGFWAAGYIIFLAFNQGSDASIEYLDSRNFTEPAFVFVIMAVCSTKPIMDFARSTIALIAKLLPVPRMMGLFITTLAVGPLLGSFITEPAAMTVTALILLEEFYKKGLSNRLKYTTLGLLFVSVSIGGTLTPYAAPPVLMVAGKWGWDLAHMLTHFGWKAVLFTCLAATTTAVIFRKELGSLQSPTVSRPPSRTPLWVTAVHLLFLVLIVMTHHHTVMFFGLFLFFLGLYSVTQEYQDNIRLREGLLVAFFLGGIVVLGEPQRWWLEPALSGLSTFALYAGSIGLTSITDNAALAYLGSQIPTLSEHARYALISGSVVGGGLTVIANAPNPVGYGLLNPHFGDSGINPLSLFLYALPYTLLAAFVFWVL